MNADLTFNTIVYKKSFDENGASTRRSTARDINTPDDLLVKNQAYVDSVTKVPGRRYTGRIDRWDIDAQSRKVLTSCYFVFAVPETAPAGAVANVTATFKAVVADASFMAAVLNSEL